MPRPARHPDRPPRRRLPLALAAALVVLSGPCLGTDPPRSERGTGEVMAEAMTRMMDAMGFSPSAAKSPADLPAMLEQAPAPPMVNELPEPFGKLGRPALEFSLPETYRRFTGQANPWQPTSLDGIWEERAGGLLIIQGYRFRLYQPHAGHFDGLIQQRGNRIALYNPATGIARPYEFALQRGRLALRDPAGALFLYRQLWLNEDDPADAFSPSPAEAAEQ